MQAGTTFQDEYVPLLYDTEEEALQECLKAYVKKSCEINEVPPYLFDEWITRLKQAIKYKCRQMEYRHENEDKEKRIADSLVRVQQKYAILTADKASNTYVIHCKTHLCKQVVTEIQSDATYKLVEEPVDELIKKDREFLLAEKLMRETPQDRDPEKVAEIPPHMGLMKDLPMFGVTVKLHKSNKLRFMAKSHRSSFVGLAKWISKSLSTMTQVSEEIWKDVFMSIVVVTKSCWVINSSKYVRSIMDRMTKWDCRQTSVNTHVTSKRCAIHRSSRM